MKINKMLIIFLALTLLIGMVSAAGYVKTNRIEYNTDNEDFRGMIHESMFDNKMCGEGQDFVIQIAPGGCDPAIVRSDLLEEQDVPVFCELQAIKINPLARIKAIDSMSFRSEGNENVRTIGFQPSYDALGGGRELTDNMWNNIGSVVFVLRKNKNESSMPEVISGNLTAKLRYDMKDAFGLRKNTFYLPMLTDSEFEQRKGQYAFFDNRGFLRAEDIQPDSATFSVYSGRSQGPTISGSSASQKSLSRTLTKGKKTPEVFLPGLDCMSAVTFELDDITYADTRAQLKINSEVAELGENERFVDGKCKISKDGVQKIGLNQKVEMQCQGDEEKGGFTLRISPAIDISINGDVSSYQLGEEIFELRSGDKRYFLGYVNYVEDAATRDPKLTTQIVEVPIVNIDESEKLTDNQLLAVASKVEKKTFLGKRQAEVYRAGRFLFQGDFAKTVGESPETFGSNKVFIKGLSTGGNTRFMGSKASILTKYFGLANEEYGYASSDFVGEKYPESNIDTISEKSLFAKIQLADKLLQKNDFAILCEEFKSRYPNSNLVETKCNDELYLANEGISSKEILIDGDYKVISLQRVVIPEYKDFGAMVTITLENGTILDPIKMTKNDIYYLGDRGKESIQLIGVDEDGARFETNLDVKGTGFTAAGIAIRNLATKEHTIKTGLPRDLSSKYMFTVSETKFTRMAKIIVNPEVKNTGTTANFTYHIGVEKRLIQLSPEVAGKLVDKLTKTIDTFNSINSRLSNVVDGLEKACVATGLALNVKNLLFSSSGESIARERVMEYWKVECAKDVSKGIFRTQSACYYNKTESIDLEVAALSKRIQDQDAELRELEPPVSGGLLEGKVVNTTALVTKLSAKVAAKLRANPTQTLKNKNGDTVNFKTLADSLTVDNWKRGTYTLDDLKDIDLGLDLYTEEKSDRYEKILFVPLYQVKVNSKHYVDIAESARKDGVDPSQMSVVNLKGDERISVVYKDLTLKSLKWELNSYSEDTPVINMIDGATKYYIILEDIIGRDEMTIKRENKRPLIFDSERSLVENNKTVDRIESSIKIVKRGAGSYNNRFINDKEFVVRYYETEPYKGLPAILPLDRNNGWYVYVKQTAPAFGRIASYDDSAQVTNFQICNIGENGLLQMGQPDDICQGFNSGTGEISSFHGLDSSETKKLYDLARNSLAAASNQYGKASSGIKINNQRVGLGEPLVNLPSGECTDYMSPKDCNLLFNVCDPVVCPASRCDLGGEYPVQDVVQSGIVGSLALCLPNANEGIYMPVCLSGVSAGLDGLNSVLGAYKECLETNIETGETVGICDKIHSVYMCEFLWKQGLPLAKIGIPKLLKAFSGENVRGGGEYSKVDRAWKNAQDSVTFFTEFYAVEAFKVFRAKSQGDIGSEVCNTFVSTAYPKGQGIFDSLSLATNPPQFNANFEAIPMTSKTNPPMVHYKVFYHIFAGKDRGAYYRVYLKGESSAYYQDAESGRVVGSSYVPRGESITITEDFTGPQGYKELCVVVNDQEKCGFGKVSTSFAADYVKDQYILGQANQKEIKSEKECIAGTASAASLLNLNVQAAANELINPAIYNKGLIRVCATYAPGSSEDVESDLVSRRWLQVGYCDDKNMKCWVDRDSVDDALIFETSRDKYLNDSTQDLIEKLNASGKYFTDVEFEEFLEKNISIDDIQDESEIEKMVKLIDFASSKVYLNNKRAHLIYLKGALYGNFSKYIFTKYVEPAINKHIANSAVAVPGQSTVTKKNIYDIATSGEFVSGKFSMKINSVEPAVCLQYNKIRWQWASSCSANVMKVVDSTEVSGTEAKVLENFEESDFEQGFGWMVKSIKKYKLEEDFVSSGDVEMKSSELITISNIDGIDELYLKYSYGLGAWRWMTEESSEGEWKKVEEDSNILYGDFSLWDKFATVVSPVIGTTYVAPNLDEKIKKIPEEYITLVRLLVEKDFNEGSLIIFSGKDAWEELSKNENIRRGRWGSQNAALRLNELKVNYSNDKESTLPKIEVFIMQLIEDGVLGGESSGNMLNPDATSPYSNGPLGSDNYMLSSGEPDFEKLKKEILGRDDRVASQEISAKCNDYASKVLLEAENNEISHDLIFAVMMKESSCGVNMNSDKGCKGLMQFCASTAYEVGLCDNIDCTGTDDRMDDNKSIAAAAKYLKKISKPYAGEDKDLFTLAAYNAGPTIISKAYREFGGMEPTWKVVSEGLTPEYLKENGYSHPDRWNDTERQKKIKEITNYVKVTASYAGVDVSRFESDKAEDNEKAELELGMSLRSSGWPLSETSEYAKSLGGKYGDINNGDKSTTKEFVDALCEDKVLMVEYCDEIRDDTTVRTPRASQMEHVSSLLHMLYLKSLKWPLDETVEYSEKLKLKYSSRIENKWFVDAVCMEEILDARECKDIKGEGGINIFDTEDDMSEVTERIKLKRDIMELKGLNVFVAPLQYVRLRGLSWPMDETINYTKSLKGHYSDTTENKLFVDSLCDDDVLSIEQCDDVRGNDGWIGSEEYMSKVRGMLLSLKARKEKDGLRNFVGPELKLDIKEVVEVKDIREYVSSGLDVDNQIKGAHPELTGLISCLGAEYLKLDSKKIVVTSITDDDLYTKSCDLSDPLELYSKDSDCVHQKDSCHYYPTDGRGGITNEEVTSMAIDIRNKGYNAVKMNEALVACNAKYPLKKFNSGNYYLLEGDHFHIALAACKGESAQTSDVVEPVAPVRDDSTTSTSFSAEIENRLSKTLNGDADFIEACYRDHNGDYFCAEYITLVFDYIFGKGKSNLIGVVGNAPSFQDNMLALGGVMVHDYSKSKSEFKDFDSLKVGDILGLKKRLNFGGSSDYTHVGIYLGKTSKGYMVSHKIGENMYIHNMGEFDESETWGIYKIMRPHQENLVISIQDYVAKNDYEKVNYNVQPGETLGSISGKFSNNLEDSAAIIWIMKSVNNIEVLQSGSVSLYVPKNKVSVANDQVVAPVKVIAAPSDLRQGLNYLKVVGVKGTAELDLWESAVRGAFKGAKLEESSVNYAIALTILGLESSFNENPILDMDDICKNVLENRDLSTWAQRNGCRLYNVNYYGKIKTEKDYFNSGLQSLKPLGSAGPMQVQINTAKKFTTETDDDKIYAELFTKNGGTFYGVSYLKGLIQIYAKDGVTRNNMQFIFADYNAGAYRSRNAAVQKQVNAILGSEELVTDGYLGKSTRSAILKALGDSYSNELSMSGNVIGVSNGASFEATGAYEMIKTKYKERTGLNPEYAIVPSIEVSDPRFSTSSQKYVNNAVQRFNTYCGSMNECTI